MAAIAAGIVVSNSLPAEPEVPKSPAVVSCQTAVAIAAAVGGSPPTAVPFHSVTFIPTRPPPYPLSSSPVELSSTGRPLFAPAAIAGTPPG